VMAAILAGLQNRDSSAGFDFRWILLCGGFLPGEPDYRALFDQPLKIPSLHVVGQRESAFMLEQSNRLMAAFEASERLETPVGHVLPIKHPKYMEKIAKWIEQKCEP